MNTYAYEPEYISLFRVSVFCVLVIALLALFVSFQAPAAAPQNIYERAAIAATPVPAQVIYICTPSDRQLQNMGLQASTHYINIPINPTIIESRLDGLMAQKTVLDGRILYKIDLPVELLISSITLDMAGGGLVYIFIEDADGKRVWERHENLSRDRYNTINMHNLTVFY